MQILPACTSWFDYVWAYFKVMVDVLTEKVYTLVHAALIHHICYIISLPLCVCLEVAQLLG